MTTTPSKKEMKKKSGTGEEKHFVKQDEKGKELLELLRQEIEVSGVVRKEIQDHKIIAVKSNWLKTGGV